MSTSQPTIASSEPENSGGRFAQTAMTVAASIATITCSIGIGWSLLTEHTELVDALATFGAASVAGTTVAQVSLCRPYLRRR